MRDLFATIFQTIKKRRGKKKETSIPNSNSKSKHSSYNPHQSPKNLKKEKERKGNKEEREKEKRKEKKHSPNINYTAQGGKSVSFTFLKVTRLMPLPVASATPPRRLACEASYRARLVLPRHQVLGQQSPTGNHRSFGDNDGRWELGSWVIQ